MHPTVHLPNYRKSCIVYIGNYVKEKFMGIPYELYCITQNIFQILNPVCVSN